MDNYNCTQTTENREIAPQLISQAESTDFSTAQEHSLVENVENQLEIAADIAPQLIAQPTERQGRAIKLTQQIITNGSIAAECMVQMGRDLKAVRDERLYSEMGFDSFEEYCEKKVGVGKRHGYNFIQVYERFGEEQLSALQSLGITKLLEIAKLDNEDMAELMHNNDVAQMSVRQLKSRVEEFEKRVEQLTLDLEGERSKNSDIAKIAAEAADLESKLEGMKKQLEAAKREKERSEQRTREIVQEKQGLENEINALKNRPVEVAVQQPTDEQLEQLRAQAREEERQAQETARITAVDAARQQEAAKYSAEIEKLKAENAALQSNAQPAPTPSGGYKEQIKFLLAEISRAFDSALSITNSIEDSDEQAKYRGALGRALKQLEDTIC